jgi:serine protease Do
MKLTASWSGAITRKDHNIMRRVLPAITFLLLAGLAPAQDDAAYRRAVDSVVIVWSYDHNWDLSTGTGVVIDAEHILTAFHVISGGPSSVDFPLRKDGELVTDADAYYKLPGMKCVVAAVAPRLDLALLRIKEDKPVMRPLPLAARSASPGAAVFTIGNDIDGALFHYAGGNVRQVYKNSWRFERSGQQVEARIVEMTAPINPGCSGGPILNGNGELLGINSATVTTANQIHKGIDISEIRAFLAEYRARQAQKEQPP